MRISRFVLDANIWITYFINKKENDLVDFVVNKKITLFICDELIIEFKRVLSYSHLEKYQVNIKEAVKFIETISVNFEINYPIKRYIKTDSNDDYVIALALQTNSGFVTTGDKDILDEKEFLKKRFPKLKILTLKELRESYL